MNEVNKNKVQHLETEPTSSEELKITAELISFLETELSVDPRRVHVWFHEGTAYLQGTVDTIEQRSEIEDMTATRIGIRNIISSLMVEMNEDF